MHHTRPRILSLLLLVVVIGVWQSYAAAVPITATATLDFSQEVAPSNPAPSDATGQATLTVDTASGLYDLLLEVTGILPEQLLFLPLPSGPSPVHIHNAPAGSNGGIVVNSGAQGVFDTLFEGADAVGFSLAVSAAPFATDGSNTVADNIAELLAGNLYLNVHTNDYASGEIRGQLAAVPLPASSVVLLIGLLGLAVVRHSNPRPSD